MNSYGITKYNPKYRNPDNIYTNDEWTSICDVGTNYHGQPFTMAEYLRIEKNYISCVAEILGKCGIKRVRATDLEKNTNELEWYSWKDIRIDQLFTVMSSCLRDESWCRIKGNHCFVHFGYDYYMYVGCKMEFPEVKEIAEKYQLYAEEFTSPYLSKVQKILKKFKTFI